MFLKILHYTIFSASKSVTKHLIDNGLDPNTEYLNDKKFFTQVLYLLVQCFGYRPKITLD